MKIAIADFGCSNMHSVEKAMEYAAPKAHIFRAKTEREIETADRVVLPGVGALLPFLKAFTKVDILRAIADRPTLGVCLGLQALSEGSEEAEGHPALGVFAGYCKQIPKHSTTSTSQGTKIKVPHMGWAKTQVAEHPLTHGLNAEEYFYYVHSYYLPATTENNTKDETKDKTQILADTQYGSAHITSIALKDNFIATQFHPEKSGETGLKIYQNFANWTP